MKTKIRRRKFLSNIGNTELIGIDISNGVLKLAHARVTSHKREILNLLNREIAGLSTEDISKIITSYLSDLKVKYLHIINVISSNLVITKNIEIPSINPQEINEIIDLQASRHTPYSREEIIIDHINIGTHKQNYTKILLVIIARNIVKRQFEILGRERINLEKVTLASEGLALSTLKLLKIEAKEAPMNLIHIDERYSDFIIVFKNKPIFIRSIPVGASHIIEDREKYKLKFVEEIQKSLEAYQTEDIDKTPNRLILTGAIDELEDVVEVLNNTLHLPISLVPYLENLTISETALKVARESKHSSFLNVIAPLVTWEELKVNLLPEEVKLRKSLEERGRELIKTGIYVLSIFVLIFLILISKIYFKTIYLEKLNKEFQPLDKEAKQVENLFFKISLIKKYLSNRGYSLETLAELYNVIPIDLKISEIKFNIKGKFSIKGTASSMASVFAFVDNMEKSEYFKDVNTRYTTKRKDGLKDVTDFEIVCLLEK